MTIKSRTLRPVAVAVGLAAASVLLSGCGEQGPEDRYLDRGVIVDKQFYPARDTVALMPMGGTMMPMTVQGRAKWTITIRLCEPEDAPVCQQSTKPANEATYEHYEIGDWFGPGGPTEADEAPATSTD